MGFNVGDMVRTRAGNGIITDIYPGHYTQKTVYKITLIEIDNYLYATSLEIEPIDCEANNRRNEKMAGIRNKYVNTKVVAPNKETGTYEPYAINKSDDLYQKALEAAKKMSNTMYGVGHSVSATVLKNDFNRFLNEVKDIKFSGPATIVFWKDGTKTIVKCQEGEHYDPKDGIEYALLKKIAGGTSNQASKMAKKYDEWLEKWIPEELKEDTELGDDLECDDYRYVTEEMKKRLIGIGEGLNGLTDKLHSVNEKLREYLNDKSEETEEK